jgi:cell wall integrity and stress response component
MKSILFAAAALVALAEALPDVGSSRPMQQNNIQQRGTQPEVQKPRLGAQTVQGCFKSSGTLKLINETVQYNSIGGCAEKICLPLKYPVGATMGGSQCFCGDEYPPKEDIVDPSNCDYDCTGFPDEACEFGLHQPPVKKGT